MSVQERAPEVGHTVISQAEEKKLRRDEKEDYLREHECDCCRFIPCCKPPRESHGVSFFCKPWFCLHSRENKFLHSVFFYESFGEIGYHFLDYHRNFFFGFATILSLLGVVMLIVGASALVATVPTIRNANWARTSAFNKTANAEFSVSVGLRALVYSKCSASGGRRLMDVAEVPSISMFDGVDQPFLRRELATPLPQSCVDSLLEYTDTAGCKATGVFGEVCSICGGVASSEATGVAFAAIGKFVALFSMQKRMYGYADSPSLKFVGICMELTGFISLLVDVLKFNAQCVGALSRKFTPDTIPELRDFKTSPGPGLICFVIGAIASFIRLLLHLLTPLPRKGKGVCVPVCKTVGMCLKCQGCCVLYDDDAVEKEHDEKLAAVHAHDKQ